jgi:hypothetical protein
MKKQIRLLGIIYIAFGCLLAAFALMVLLLTALASLHLIKDNGPPGGIGAALTVFVLMGTLTLWFVNTGQGLMNYRSGARLTAIVVSAILLCGVNIILMLTQDQPYKTRTGFTVFHLACIGIGLYGLIVLLSKSGRQAFQ